MAILNLRNIRREPERVLPDKNDYVGDIVSTDPERVLPNTIDVVEQGDTRNIHGKISDVIEKPMGDVAKVLNFFGMNETANNVRDLRDSVTGTIGDIRSAVADPLSTINKILSSRDPAKVMGGIEGAIDNGVVEQPLPNNNSRKVEVSENSLEEPPEEVSKNTNNVSDKLKLYIPERNSLVLIDFTDVKYDEDIEFRDGKWSQLTKEYINKPRINPSFQGYKSVINSGINTLSISDSYWDMKMSVPLGYGLPLSFLPHIPKQYKDYQPILSFEMGDFSMEPEQVDIFNGAIEIPKGIKRDTSMSITIADDDNMTWSRYFDEVVKRMYNPKLNAAAPYKHVVFQFDLLIYNSIRKVYYRKRPLAVLSDYTKKYSGTSDNGSSDDLQLSFSIVGDLNLNKSIMPM